MLRGQIQSVTLASGDGIGPEITRSVRAVFAAANVPIAWEEVPIGLEALEKTGELLPREFGESLLRTRVALKGPTTTPVGTGHRSVNVGIRKDFGLFANVRPVKNLPGVPCLQSNVDLMIVRENTEDLYAGIEYNLTPDVAVGMKVITRAATERVMHHACRLSQDMGYKRVTIVHKANIMKCTDGLFLRVAKEVGALYPGLKVDDCIIDNFCMQIVRRPDQFQVVVTENLYGDIISDLASGLVGGLGVAAGANYGEDCAVFEAVHGSAPDIAGMGLANPTALLLSGALMLDHMGLSSYAERIRCAILDTLAQPELRTRDLGGPLGLDEFTASIVAKLP